MKNFFVVTFFMLILVCGFVSPAISSPIEDARKAYENGDYEAAVKILIPLGEEGNVEAQFALGVIYSNGLGLPNVPVDHRQAFSWFTKAAEKNYFPAQNELGDMYSNGRGVPRDYSQAMNWYLKAANQGDPYAQHNIGNLFRIGKGVSQDYAEALSWYRKAADQDLWGAQYALGDLFAQGQGTTQDIVQAYKWYSLALSRIEVPFFQDQVQQTRDRLADKMTQSQIADALHLVDDWNYSTRPH